MKAATLLASIALFLATAPAQTIFSPNDPGETPNRTYDVQHYRIEVDIHDQAKSLDGRTTITLVPLMTELRSVLLQAADMTVKRVTIGKGKALKFQSDPFRLTIDLDRAYTPKETIALTVEYSCTPKIALTFNGPDSGFPKKRWQMWSQGEDTTNHYWFPCYDAPNDKATSEVFGTISSKYGFLSNGKLVGVVENKKAGTKTWHYSEEHPHSSYLIMIAAGDYAVLHDRLGKLPLEYWVYPDDTTNAGKSFHETPAMISFFNEFIGYDYAWEKYAQIIFQDHFGGMENSSATTLADQWAVPDERSRLESQPSSLIAHELAHQWWGDVVTCKDFRHLWLNESFATYFDALYHEHARGKDEFDYTMYQNQGQGLNVDTTRGRRPIVSVESYGENLYPRGAAVLHMLRFVLGDDLFRRSLKHYITKNQFRPVETNDLKLAIEEETGQNLQWFFDEWVYKAGHPVFALSYTWDASAKTLALTVKQTQAMDSLTGVFRMPVDVEVMTATGSMTHRIGITTADTTFSLPCAEKPSVVIFDKGNWLLKEIRWTRSVEEWQRQATMATNIVDRMRAVRELTSFPATAEIANTLADRAQHDPFWSVRFGAAYRAGVLAQKSDDVKAIIRPALLAAMKDVDPRVRNQAVQSLTQYRGTEVAQAFRNALNDPSYNVLASAVSGLAQVDSSNALPVVRQYLDYPIRNNNVGNVALRALADLDSTSGLRQALTSVQYGHATGTRFTAMNILRRYGAGNAEAIAAVTAQLGDKADFVKSFAARTLGDIGDASSLPALEALTTKDNGGFYLLTTSVAEAAKESMEKIKKREEGK